MSRSLTSGMQTEITSDVLTPILLVEFDFDSGALNLWSGISNLSWDSKTWTGAGNLMSLGEIEESTEVKAVGSSVTITGLDQSIVSLALAEEYQGRSAKIWVGALDANNDVVSDPFAIFGGRMDVMTIQESGNTASISIAIENRLIDFERTKIRRYTDQDQKIDYPNDKGFEFVSSIQDKEIVWGRK